MKAFVKKVPYLGSFLLGLRYVALELYRSVFVPSKKVELNEVINFGSREADESFRDLLVGCKNYVEYGCGSSTIFAASINKNIYSVESDKKYIDFVKDYIDKKYPSSDAERVCLYRGVGPVREWGKPLFSGFSGKKTRQLFKRYSDFPPIKSLDYTVVLVDGRFRVACVLKALIALREKKNSFVILDDAANRRHYDVLYEWCSLKCSPGRMRVFSGIKDEYYEKVLEEIKKYENDWR